MTELKKIPIVECGEPMVKFLEVSPELLFDRPRFKYRRELYARESLALKLGVAARALPDGYRLSVLECWRAPLIQMRMYKAVWNRFQERNPEWSESRLRRVVNQFTAPLDSKVPPPHTTGGAVDLALVGPDGERCDMHSPFESHDPRGFFTDAPGLGEVARTNRELMAEALLSAELTNYPSEYWHWSFGDQGWAYRGGHAHAVYGGVSPEGWNPDPDDDNTNPLELISYQD